VDAGEVETGTQVASCRRTSASIGPCFLQARVYRGVFSFGTASSVVHCVRVHAGMLHLGCVRFGNRGGRNGIVLFLGYGMVLTLCSVRKNLRNGTVPSLCSVLEWDENGMEWNENGIILNSIIYFLNWINYY
jgi:hypothetical protein